MRQKAFSKVEIVKDKWGAIEVSDDGVTISKGDSPQHRAFARQVAKAIMDRGLKASDDGNTITFSTTG